MRLVEGNHLSSSKDNPVPLYCPLCGKPLTEMWGWDATECVYPMIVCYGNKPRWLIALQNAWGTFSDREAAHYVYQLPVIDKKEFLKKQRRFDTETGEYINES